MTVVAVLSMKGGVGKTSVTLGLASAAWDRGLRTLVIDMDPQANATMALEVDSPAFTTSDVLADGRAGVARDAVTVSGWNDAIHVIPAERSLEHRSVPDGRNSALRLRTSLATLPDDYPLVVIDCPPSLGELTRNALSAADRAVIVTEPSSFALHGATEALEAVEVIAEATNPSLRTACVVVNRFDPDDRDMRYCMDRLLAEHGGLVHQPALLECAGVRQSQRAGTPIHSWNSPGSRDVADQFDDLLDTLLPPPRPTRSQPTFSLKRYLA